VKPGKAIAIALPLLLVALAGCETFTHHAAADPPHKKVANGCVSLRMPFIGVVLPPPQPQALKKLTAASGVSPQAEQFYATFGVKFLPGREDVAEKAGVFPVLQWNPGHISLTAIAHGRYDGYLRRYALAVRSWGCPLVMSFGHEMNGRWYPWGWHHQPAKAFVAAWRHVVTVFRSEHATNVTWMWTPNRFVTGASRMTNPAPWWPGSAYVNWVGLDAYYSSASETFGELLDQTLTAVRKLTGDPVVLAETGVWPGRQQAAQIGALFNGAVAAELSGVIYFDLPASEPWQISSPSSLAAFRNAVRAFG
jgi:mannan endo-1,4-beta-mannosidase